ncbi:MAG: hypothetical protein OEY22_06875 [Candidatus Bathyarchaeota archaeon]|nr:hypothetical protein [Candidatus Bathyarchaeota archaeon]MDH5787380.1 hypothetical protein [Candidatus Bathyarchaeota archaeon]
MSEGGGFGLSFAERFFGLLLIITGAIAMYYTFLSTNELGVYSAFFGLLSVIPLVLGLILMTAKIE